MNRNTLLIPALLLVLVSAAVAWQQREHALKLEAQVASLTADVRQKESDANEQRELAARLKTQNDAYTNEASVLREKLALRTEAAPADAVDPQASATPTPKKKGKMSELLSGMMKDPKMKEMMRKQQAVALKQMYGDFVKERRLSPQQAEQFFDLLSEKQNGAMEDGMSALNDETTEPGAPTPNPQAVADRKAEADRQLQMLLGGGGYADYQAYEKTTMERMTLGQVRQQLAVSNTPLGDEQAKTLLQVMVDEGSKTPASPLQSGSANTRETMRALSDPNNAEQFYQRQADLNQRILNRAGSILKPDQYSALESFQKQQLEMQKLGMEMARKMMGEEKDEGHTTIIMPGTAP